MKFTLIFFYEFSKFISQLLQAGGLPKDYYSDGNTLQLNFSSVNNNNNNNTGFFIFYTETNGGKFLTCKIFHQIQ